MLKQQKHRRVSPLQLLHGESSLLAEPEKGCPHQLQETPHVNECLFLHQSSRCPFCSSHGGLPGLQENAPPPTWVEIVEGSEHQGWCKLLETVVAGAAP